MKYTSLLAVVCCLVLLQGLLCARQVAHATCREYSGLIQNGGYGVADLSGNIVSECNLEQIYIPASIIKIVTALAAYEILGPDFRFTTEFYLDRKNALYIKGLGDPLLISEQVRDIATLLKKKGLDEVSGIFVDNSAYAIRSMPPGSVTSDNPYDAPVAATSVNFNSLPIRIDSRGRIRSAEKQTPPVSMMGEIGTGKGPGSYRLNICADGCPSPQNQAARYTCELFGAFFTRAGIRVSGDYGVRDVPAEGRHFYTHRSKKNLEEIIRVMLYYSSNFIANQVFLTCGAVALGYPATWDKAVRVLREILVRELGVEAAESVVVVDGAGLSRDNRMSAAVMLKVLEVFAPHASLLRTYRGVPAKTGTLKGVYNFAGYLDDQTPYVIMLNQNKNRRVQVLDRLKKEHLRSGRHMRQPSDKK